MLPLLMLEVVEAHILPFAGTHMLLLLAEGTAQQNICLYSLSRNVPVPPPSHTLYISAGLPTDNKKNMSTSEEAGYSTRPNP